MKNFEIPTRYPTVNKSVRFPVNVVDDIENLIRGKGCTFTDFVVAAVKSAIEELKENENKENQ